MIQDNYKGFALFNDVVNAQLRINNQATVLANIAADNMRDSKLSPKGVSLVLGYFSAISPEDRANVQIGFVNKMKEHGFQLS